MGFSTKSKTKIFKFFARCFRTTKTIDGRNCPFNDTTIQKGDTTVNPQFSILMKDNKTIKGKGNLYIEDLKPADAGVYRCLARNGNGEEKTDINLILQG